MTFALKCQNPVLFHVVDFNPKSISNPELQGFIHIFHGDTVFAASNADIAVGTDDTLLEFFDPIPVFGGAEATPLSPPAGSAGSGSALSSHVLHCTIHR